LPLVSGGSPKATAGSTAGPADAANESRPQTPQKRSPSDILFPQPGQNELIDSSSLQHVLSRGYGGRFVGRHPRAQQVRYRNGRDDQNGDYRQAHVAENETSSRQAVSLKPPRTLRISDSETCRKITAAIANGRMTKSSPQIRLAMAFPLVSPGPTGDELLAGMTAEPVRTSLPQTRQNLSSALTLLPQPAQNEATPYLQRSNVRSVAFRGAQKFARNILSVRLAVNAQVRGHLLLTPRFDMVPSMDETRDESRDETRDAAGDAANVPLTSCPHCAAQMPATAAFCPGCGRPMLGQSILGEPMQTEARARGRVGALPENVAGALAYFTFVPAVLFLILEPYNKNRFVRFHSIQCLLLWGASGLFAIALKLASVVLFIIPVLGPLLVWLVSTVVVLAAVVIWAVLVVKGFQGEMFKLPVLGDFAAQQAGDM